MSFLKSFEEKVKQNFNIWDVAMTKWVGILFGLIVGAYYPEIIKENATILIVILGLMGIRLFYKMCLKK